LGDALATRSIDSTQETLVNLSTSEEFFILNFFVPIRSDYAYEMEILDQKGKRIDWAEIKSRDSIGNFSIVGSSSLFPNGHYTLLIKEMNRPGEIKEEYRFRFRIDRS
jgi:hypothetical protein